MKTMKKVKQMLQLSERFSYRTNCMIGFCYIAIHKKGDTVTVIVTEIPDNPGVSICDAFEDLFVQVCKFFNLDPNKVNWVEHWPAWIEENGYNRPDDNWYEVEFEWLGNCAVNPCRKPPTHNYYVLIP